MRTCNMFQNNNPFTNVGEKMKRLSLFILTVFAFTSFSFLAIFNVAAEANTCVLKSDMAKVYVAVWDDDSDGNRQDKIFEGWLESGERQMIKSRTGYIDFSYKSANDYRSYGDNFKTCSGGNIVRVP